MNKIIFTCQYFTIRVREVVIFLLLLILLLFGLKACQNNETEKKKEEKIENICKFTNENINDFNKLMSRADLCSEGWFKDLDGYIARIEDQNRIVKTKKKTEYKKVLKYQIKVVDSLKAFKEKQEDKTIDALQKTLTEYQEFYGKTCVKGKVGN